MFACNEPQQKINCTKFSALNGSLPRGSKCPHNNKAHRNHRKIQSVLPNRCQKRFAEIEIEREKKKHN